MPSGAATEEGSLSSVPNSAKKMASNMKARYEADKTEENKQRKE